MMKPLLYGAAAFIVIIAIAAALAGKSSPVLGTDAAETAGYSDAARVPWDYRVVEGTVGDLIGSDMTVLPDNKLLPNDENYATGDRVWTLQYMSADLLVNEAGSNEIRLSAWNTIKTYKDQKKAEQEMAELKVSLTAEVELVGVYKTQLGDDTRCFAVMTLPSGNRIKQPIDDERYNALKSKQTAEVLLEEVHDYEDYDAAYAKFRGWAN